MTESFVFDVGFQKAGQSNYSAFNLPSKNELTPTQIHSFALKTYMENTYGSMVKSPIIRQWAEEMTQIEFFRYMSIPFTAVSLIILDQYLVDLDIADLAKVLKTVIFNDDKIMAPFLENLIEKSRRKEKEYVEFLAKKILFNYIYKIFVSRSSAKASYDREYVDREDEVNLPKTTGIV